MDSDDSTSTMRSPPVQRGYASSTIPVLAPGPRAWIPISSPLPEPRLVTAAAEPVLGWLERISWIPESWTRWAMTHGEQFAALLTKVRIYFFCAGIFIGYMLGVRSAADCQRGFIGVISDRIWAWKVSRWEYKTLYFYMDMITGGGLQVLLGWMSGMLVGPLPAMMMSGAAFGAMSAAGYGIPTHVHHAAPQAPMPAHFQPVYQQPRPMLMAQPDPGAQQTRIDAPAPVSDPGGGIRGSMTGMGHSVGQGPGMSRRQPSAAAAAAAAAGAAVLPSYASSSSSSSGQWSQFPGATSRTPAVPGFGSTTTPTPLQQMQFQRLQQMWEWQNANGRTPFRKQRQRVMQMGGLNL